MPETPYSQHQYAYGLSDPVLMTDPSGRCSATGDDYCHEDHNNAQWLACMLQSGSWDPFNHGCQGGNGMQQQRGDDDTHECLGYLGAVEVRMPVAGGGTAPACLHAPLTQYDPTYFSPPRKPKQPTIIVDVFGNLVCVNDGSDSQDEEKPAQLGQSSFLPDLGIPTPPDWLKKLRRGLDGLLRPRTLFQPVGTTLRERFDNAEEIVSKFIGVSKNTSKIPVSGTPRNTIPDFVSPELFAESKYLEKADELMVKTQQYDTAMIAKKRGIPYYIFTTEGKKIQPGLKTLIESTGGEIIVLFKQK